MNRLSFGSALLAVLILPGCSQAPDEAAATAEVEPMETAVVELLPNARQPMEGVLAGGQPTAEQFAAAAAAGYRTVINMRMLDEAGTAEEPALVADLGMEYIALPTDGATGMNEEMARKLDQALENAERPVLLHCGSGNRVGGLLALRSYYVEGRSAAEALQYGLDSGLTGLEPAVRENLDAASAQ